MIQFSCKQRCIKIRMKGLIESNKKIMASYFVGVGGPEKSRAIIIIKDNKICVM